MSLLQRTGTEDSVKIWPRRKIKGERVQKTLQYRKLEERGISVESSIGYEKDGIGGCGPCGSG
jgi:hypothetical protein